MIYLFTKKFFNKFLFFQPPTNVTSFTWVCFFMIWRWKTKSSNLWRNKTITTNWKLRSQWSFSFSDSGSSYSGHRSFHPHIQPLLVALRGNSILFNGPVSLLSHQKCGKITENSRHSNCDVDRCRFILLLLLVGYFVFLFSEYDMYHTDRKSHKVQPFFFLGDSQW